MMRNGRVQASADSQRPADQETSPPGKDNRGRRPARPRVSNLLSGIALKVFHQAYRRETYRILSFDLKNRPIPSPRVGETMVFRLLTPDDAAQFLELWRDKKALKSKRFRQRMESGYVGIGTWGGGRLIGVNWLATTKDYDYLTGLWIKLAPGACYALDLQEHEAYQGRRIGLATLAHSLREAQQRGFSRQFICVNDDNTKMLAGAKYLLGYRLVGEIEVTYWFGRPRSRWRVGQRRGRGGTLELGD